MYAIVEIAGKQFRVVKDMKLKVPLLEVEPGKSVDFDQVLLLEDDKGEVRFGTPVIGDTNVTARVIEHGRDPKVIVFKKKRRKGYKKKRGHRQDFSLIEITGIGAAKKPKAAAKEEPKAEAPAAKQEKPKTAAPKKPAAEKKTAAKKKTTVEKAPAAAKTKPATARKTSAAKKEPKAKAPAAKQEKPKTAAAKKTAKKDVKED
jgi:large subunit ribosomal protein L21